MRNRSAASTRVENSVCTGVSGLRYRVDGVLPRSCSLNRRFRSLVIPMYNLPSLEERRTRTVKERSINVSTKGGTRTLTRCKPDWILSPARLPIPPLWLFFFHDYADHHTRPCSTRPPIRSRRVVIVNSPENVTNDRSESNIMLARARGHVEEPDFVFCDKCVSVHDDS